MLTEIKKTLADYDNWKRQSYIDYEKEGHKLRKTYTIEYCDNEGIPESERINLYDLLFVNNVTF